MGKSKTTEPQTDGRDLIVIWWDGFGQERQATDKKSVPGMSENEIPLQWEFTRDEAVALCKKQIRKGALKAEVWRPGSTPEKIAAFDRSNSGECRQTFPRK